MHTFRVLKGRKSDRMHGCRARFSGFAFVGTIPRASPRGTALYRGTILGGASRCSPRPASRRLESDRLLEIITYGLQPGLIQRFRLSKRR